MKKSEFVDKAINLASDAGLTVKTDRQGRRAICFNTRSNKWLHEEHLAALCPEILEQGITDRAMNSLIKDVAPGRPCTHVGMRRIAREIAAGALR